ncbi:MAG: Endonuclease/exonuclease/phosphatase, partial [Burkholderiales bacterium]|nr:Endonuclease/exonuclease/phosphatase [Burkholderiales bacterium]
MSWLFAAALCVGAAMIVATVLPLARRTAWWIRIFDFPRLQILFLAAGALALFLAFREGSSAWQNAFALLLLAAIAYQAYMMFPYTVL